MAFAGGGNTCASRKSTPGGAFSHIAGLRIAGTDSAFLPVGDTQLSGYTEIAAEDGEHDGENIGQSNDKLCGDSGGAGAEIDGQGIRQAEGQGEIGRAHV